MEPGAHESKRPRLTTTGSWSKKIVGQSVSLPQPNPPHLPPASGGPHPHHAAPPQYQPPPSFSRPPEPPLPPTHHQPHDDRRLHQHHDHDLYPPIQDTPRQLPPSPAHPPYAPYPPRDPIVKRDIGEEPTLPQLRRPSSTGHAVDGLPPPPHGPPHSNQHHPEDPRRHMNFDSGASMPHSPALYRPQPLPQGYHPPPTPVTQQPHYEAPHTYGPPPPMYPATLEIQAASAKRKAQRASQACDNCRQLKAKCDETKPCKNCREKNVECKYRDPPAKQPDKVTSEMLDLLTFLRDQVIDMKTSIDKRLNHIGARLSILENGSKQGNTDVGPMKLESIEQDDPPGFQEASISDVKDVPEEEATENSTPGPTSVVEPDMSPNEAMETLRRVEEDNIETSPGPTVKPGRPTMPPNHTTLASLLLKWKSISNMVQHILEAQHIRYVQEYPICIEQQRGGLRIFGRGEGHDTDLRSSDKGTPQDFSMTDAEDGSEAYPTPPASGQELWGQVGSPAYGPGVDYKGGAMNSDGNPDWDSSKVWKYVQSFKENILTMHPIIIPKELDAMVKVFLETLPRSSNAPNYKPSSFSVTAGFVHPSSSASSALPETGAKRKRSPATEEQSPHTAFRKPGRPYRNVQSTLVLLVLALGKICLYRGKIPDVVHDPDDVMSNSPLIRNGLLASPGQGSPPGQKPPSQSSGLPSPKDTNQAIIMSRRSSLQGNVPLFNRTSPTHKRNLDVIPGLEYFALASDIMGGDYGAFDLRHVHVHILAGLYQGQLGRVLDSWEHITTASRKLQVVLRPSLSRLSQLGMCGPELRRDNQLALAFWTCLQLESDILAELPLPQSGILQYESQMPYPNHTFVTTQGFPPHIVEGYMAQLYLRKQLNKVHNLLYDPEKELEPHRVEAMEAEVNEIQRLLKHAKSTWVPGHYRWNDGDDLPNEILSARLRAKYWGSQVILYRPFLKLILEGDAQHPPPFQRENGPPDVMILKAIEERRASLYGPQTIENARLAISALIESTRAFHGIDTSSKRIIITNVFGTAHAQWGNLLTLAACYKDDHLRQWIPADILSDLFNKTIQFFRTISHPSSALTIDMNILIGLARELGLYNEPIDSSFSSITSAGGPPAHHSGGNYYFPGATSPTMMRPP